MFAYSQTPDFNAPEIINAVLDACRRDVICTLYVCLGYNDQGEMLPMQGGTNSRVYSEMCATLNKEGKRKNLKACWYVAKDRDRPIDAAAKERTCHVKFCCIDEQVVIAGNGNQGTPSPLRTTTSIYTPSRRTVLVPLAGVQCHG